MKNTLAYRIARHPSSKLGQFIRLNPYYKKLAEAVDYDAPPDKSLSAVCDRIAKSLVSMRIRERRDMHGPIDEFDVMRLMGDFDFLIRKYALYRVHPEAGDLSKAPRSDFRVLAGISKVRVDDKEYGGKYRKVFDELLDAASSG